MNCPVCGKPMTPGYLCAKHPLIWTPREHKFTIIPGKNDVKLAGAFDTDREAYICEACRKVVVDY